MKTRTCALILSACIAGNAGVTAAPNAPITVRFPRPDGRTCTWLLNGGDLTVSTDGKKVTVALAGAAVVKSNCFSQAEQERLFHRAVDFTVTNPTIVVDLSDSGGFSITRMKADQIGEAAR